MRKAAIWISVQALVNGLVVSFCPSFNQKNRFVQETEQFCAECAVFELNRLVNLFLPTVATVGVDSLSVAGFPYFELRFQGFAVESLPLVSILHDSLRSVCTCSDVDRFPDKKPYADIAYRTYYRIYSCFDETLERCYVEDALDVFLFALESIPFCCCSQGLTDLGDTSGWTHALVRMVRKVLTDDRFHFKPRTVSYHIVRILEKCCGVTVKNLLVLTNQLAKVFASFFETPGEIETVMKTVWKDYLVSSDYQEHSMQLLCVITSQHLVEFYRHRYYGVVNGIIKIFVSYTLVSACRRFLQMDDFSGLFESR